MSALFLIALALVDGSLLGFRAAAGRNGHVDKRAYMRRGVLRGLASAVLVVLGGIFVALALVALRGLDLWPVLVHAGMAAVRVFAAFAALVIVALLGWMIPITDLRTLLTVSILGPGTLARPYVIGLGLTAGFLTEPCWEVLVLALYGAVTMLMLERVLTRRYYPIDEALLGAP